MRGLPVAVSFKDLQNEFEGATRLEKDRGTDVAVTFETISDAQAVVSSGMVYQGRTLSFDFVNDRVSNQKDRRANDAGRRDSGDRARGRSPSPVRSSQAGRLSRSSSRGRRYLRNGSLSPKKKAFSFFIRKAKS